MNVAGIQVCDFLLLKTFNTLFPLLNKVRLILFYAEGFPESEMFSVPEFMKDSRVIN